MSQEKVNRYKEEKANRKAIMKKEKRKHFLRKCVVGIAAAGLIVWIGYSGYHTWETGRPRQNAEIDYDEFTSYLNKLENAE